MRAYKGVVIEGKVALTDGASLPEGATVTVTIGEAEYLRATLRSALRRNDRRRAKARALRPVFESTGR